MPDKQPFTHLLDTRRIAIHNHAEVKTWCQAFGCKEHELKKAVQVVGTSGATVRKYLGK